MTRRRPIRLPFRDKAGDTYWYDYCTIDTLGDGSTSGYENFAQMSSLLRNNCYCKLTKRVHFRINTRPQRIHGLTESELANFVGEILAEINREVVRNKLEKPDLCNCFCGTFNLDVDAMVDGLLRNSKDYCSNRKRDSNAKERSEKGNFILCSSDVASALLILVYWITHLR